MLIFSYYHFIVVLFFCYCYCCFIICGSISFSLLLVLVLLFLLSIIHRVYSFFSLIISLIMMTTESLTTSDSLFQNGTYMSKLDCIKTVIGTYFLFILMNLTAGVYLKVFFRSLRNHDNFWRFKNTFLSWTHSIIASVLVFLK